VDNSQCPEALKNGLLAGMQALIGSKINSKFDIFAQLVNPSTKEE
jgi:hypothetical protein